MLETPKSLDLKFSALALGATFVLGLLVALYMYSVDNYSLVYFGDAVSHMIGARKLIDWGDNPGIEQIGTVWLPLPHLLLLPFTLVDPLFTTGFAGLAVSLPCFAITSMLLYKIIRNNTTVGFSYVALIGALLYASNPNIIYMGITAMTEAPFMLFFVGGAYYFQKWYETQKLQNILYSSIFIALATLCRYEGWIIPIFLLIAVPLAMKLKEKSALPEVEQTAVKGKVLAILVSLISISGIVLWLAWNETMYGDALEFANAQYYSASSQAFDRPIRATLFLQPLNVFHVYGATAYVFFGPILLIAAPIGLILHSYSRRQGKRSIVFMMLFIAPIFTVISLLVGIGEMTFWFNSRFLILLAPLIVVLASIFLGSIGKRYGNNRILLGAIIGAFFIYNVVSPVFLEVPTFFDARNGFLYGVNPYSVDVGEQLKIMYDNGEIMTLTGAGQEHRIMITSGIPLRNFDEILESTMWKNSFKEPWLHDKWIILGKEPNSDGVEPARYWSENEDQLLQHYNLAYENEYYKIFLLKE